MSSSQYEPVCAFSDLPEDGAIEVRLSSRPPLFAIVLRRGEAVHAFENVCPHAGRPLNWAPDRFLFTPEGHLVCAVHGASFVATTGEAVAGPCVGASLKRLSARVEAGQVYVSPS